MATPKLLALSKTLLRRGGDRPLYQSLTFSAQFQTHHHFLRQTLAPHPSNSQVRHLIPYNFLASRSFSTSDSDKVRSSVDLTETGGCEVVGLNEDSILPVRALTSLLDGYHDFTGFPWWLVIASSTLALRLTLFPFVVLQLRKLKRIGEVFPKLPPPLPPPLSGISIKDQLTLFRKEKNAVGCPSFLWFLASFAVQIPLFFVCITTIRRMSLDHHPGFDCFWLFNEKFCNTSSFIACQFSLVFLQFPFPFFQGGIFWFQNLTEYPNGVLGPIFPLLIAGLHYVNVQIAFRSSSLGKTSGVFGTLAKYYKLYLEVLMVPVLFITFHIPQASLIYWLTNISFSGIQQLLLQHSDVRQMLGLPNKAPVGEGQDDVIGKLGVKEPNESGLQHRVSVHNLSPRELVALSVTFLAKGEQDRVVELLRLALEKEPECVRALLLMGQTFLQKNLLSEAIEYLELAVSKLLTAGHPVEVEDVDLLILSSTWAGSAYMRQGKNEEGMVHLERLACLEEPEDPKSKAHYHDGLLMLSSALSVVGRKDEAAEHLRRLVAYDPDRYQQFLDQCVNEEDDFTNDLVSSRRAE